MSKEKLNPAPGFSATLGGDLKLIVNSVINSWLLVAPRSNPAMLEVFADRDTKPYRDMVPWAGEFAGKYLVAAVQAWKLSGSTDLSGWIGEFVDLLISMQADDGYLGPWPEDCRLTNISPAHHGEDFHTWDTWGHYHILLGLIFWHEASGSTDALQSACRIADLICGKYLGAVSPRLGETGWSEMNLAPAHALARLHRITNNPIYLEMSLQIVTEFETVKDGKPLAGDYLRLALSGKQFFEMPKPRWESLHPIMAMAELYWATGDNMYREAFENIWWSIVEFDRHNNGGFSSGEQSTGNPYDPAPIETCCTIAWIAMSVEMAKLTGNSVVIDEIELSTLNSVLGMHSVSGRWVTYDTPSDGIRRASADHIVFQARAGSSELNCCSVNGPRGLGIISDWAMMWDGQSLHINYYGSGTFSTTFDDELRVEVRQKTAYPRSGIVSLEIAPSRDIEMPIRFRIPSWSLQSVVSINGNFVDEVKPGEYLEISRTWRTGDIIEIELDMTVHYWPGEKQCLGLASIYRGPILLAFDRRYNRHLEMKNPPGTYGEKKWTISAEDLPVPILSAGKMELEPAEWDNWLPPRLLFKTRAKNGELIYLCDFGSAGETGSLYRSWLPVEGIMDAPPFSRNHPLRSIQYMQ